jgi:hypothetical protein
MAAPQTAVDIKDDASFAFVILPAIDILMHNPAHDWGKPFYPVVK